MKRTPFDESITIYLPDSSDEEPGEVGITFRAHGYYESDETGWWLEDYEIEDPDYWETELPRPRRRQFKRDYAAVFHQAVVDAVST